MNVLAAPGNDNGSRVHLLNLWFQELWFSMRGSRLQFAGLTICAGSLTLSMVLTNSHAADTNSKARMQLTSSAFAEGEAIPPQHTCDDKNMSPPLKWNDVPAGTKSLALIADDPDAP